MTVSFFFGSSSRLRAPVDFEAQRVFAGDDPVRKTQRPELELVPRHAPESEAVQRKLNVDDHISHAMRSGVLESPAAPYASSFALLLRTPGAPL
ncbi:MAG TPA: hypothetical protein VMI75_02850, partial [Polyangiaceae bacterium]|nr:hypothetical protein [Polyangiaceae bacterium]